MSGGQKDCDGTCAGDEQGDCSHVHPMTAPTEVEPLDIDAEITTAANAHGVISRHLAFRLLAEVKRLREEVGELRLLASIEHNGCEKAFEMLKVSSETCRLLGDVVESETARAEEAAAETKQLADAIQQFRNEPSLGKYTRLRCTTGYAALCRAWEAYSDPRTEAVETATRLASGKGEGK